MSIAQTWFGHG